jgi:[ribosomal protein S5]-alanine N-acetyltransferase
MMLGSAPGWPAVLADGPVLLRPYRRNDARAWSDVRIANQQWLAPWESSPPGPWAEMNSVRAYLYVYRDMKRAARRGESMPFAVCLRDESGRDRLVGHLNLGNIVRRAFSSAYVGYWIDARVAGRGIIPTALALAVDHAFGPGGLHRLQADIRPENGPSQRLVERLGFTREGLLRRYLDIDGDWRDHLSYALLAEDSPRGVLAVWTSRAPRS